MHHQRTTAGLLKSALLGAATLGAISLAGAGVAQASQINFDFGNVPASDVSHYSCTGSGSVPSGNCDTGLSSATFTSSGVSVTADSFYGAQDTQTSPGNTLVEVGGSTVSQRSGSGSESGLGVRSATPIIISTGDSISGSSYSGSSLEISGLDKNNKQEYLLVNLSNVISNSYILDTFSLGSAQANESGFVSSISVYGSSTPLSGNELILSNFTDLTGAIVSPPSGGEIKYSGAVLKNIQYLLITANTTNSNTANVLLTSAVFDPGSPSKLPEPGSLALLGTGLLGLGVVIRRRRRKA